MFLLASLCYTLGVLKAYRDMEKDFSEEIDEMKTLEKLYNEDLKLNKQVYDTYKDTKRIFDESLEEISKLVESYKRILNKL